MGGSSCGIPAYAIAATAASERRHAAPDSRSAAGAPTLRRDAAGDAPPAGARERMLPSGVMHLVFRLAGPPIRLFRDVDDHVGRSVGHAVVGGMRTGFHLRDRNESAHVIGLELRAGMDERL